MWVSRVLPAKRCIFVSLVAAREAMAAHLMQIIRLYRRDSLLSRLMLGSRAKHCSSWALVVSE